MDETASPLTPTGNLSAVHLPDQWFVACSSAALGSKPLAVSVQGLPLVLYRSEGKPVAFLDRCPHRNAPLSIGRVEGPSLRCSYHGWLFDPSGRCTQVPGSCEELGDVRARRATGFAAKEQDGFVWVYSTPDAEPVRQPFAFPSLSDPRYTTVRREVTVNATVHASAENALDVPHTAFLHGGLFRTAKKQHTIEVVVRRTAEMVEAEYVGEPRPPGLAARMLSPGGGLVVHHDRFLLPSIAQVEYRLGEASHLLITSAMTPLSDTETVMHAVVTFRTPLPGALLKVLLLPVAMRIFRQDAVVLARQSEAIRRFGGERFASTGIDVLGQQILRLLKMAERGEIAQGPAEEVARLKMLV